MHPSSWPKEMQCNLLTSKFDTIAMANFNDHTNMAVNNVSETEAEVLLLAAETNFITYKHMMHTKTHKYTHPSTVPGVAPSRAAVKQVVSPMGCMFNPPGANSEIVPLGQEPADKDRKWNLSTWYHSTAKPRGRNISTWRPWWISCYSQNVFT